MNAENLCVEDLLARARRGSLSDGERRLLREALAASSDDRFLYEAGCEFDDEAPVRPGDDLRIERLARLVRKRTNKSKRKALEWSLALGAGLGMLVGAATVSALQSSAAFFARRSVEAAANAQHASSAPRAVSGMRGPAGPPSAAPAPEPDPTKRPNRVLPEVAPRARSAGDRAVRGADGVLGAPTPVGEIDAAPGAELAPRELSSRLFSEASRARIRGEISLAIALYSRLEAQFPQSPEASTARLSLGMLYQQAGRADLALEQFRAYRERGAAEALAEALWGEAAALGKLGRVSEQRATLEALLLHYPKSAYAAAAQKNLALIDRGAH